MDVVFCGLGMGSVTGSTIVLFVVGKFSETTSIVLCSFISLIFLGLFCNLLYLRLDMHFNYFGSGETPVLFIVNGMSMSAIGGWLVGWLSFSSQGRSIATKLGL